MKIMVERDGQRQEITGWRRWAIAIPVILVAAIVAAAVIVLVLGITLTLGVVLLIAVPAVLVLALMARVLMNRSAAGPN
ncbi:MAG TPA: hypothetical protein VII40_20685 [Xanthobacteraceae bacterium]|jgi:hypothetical protein